jgi:HlyD family secretion protein
MRTRSKVLIAVGALVLIGAVVALNLRGSRKPSVEVEVEPVKVRKVVAVVEASGQIQPSVSVDISSDVIGRITAIGPEEGDRVRAGDFLIQIDPTQYEQRAVRAQAALDSAQARLTQGRATLAQAELEDARQERLLEAHLISQAAFDASRSVREVNRANVAASEFDVAQSQAQLEEARDARSKCRILSPMDGIVTRRNVEVGETAISGTLNNAGSLLLTIADLSTMETEVEVDETDVVEVKLGQEAEVKLDAFPDRAFKGAVTKMANSSVLGQASLTQPQQSANYKVTVRLLEIPEAIRPGLSATARITTAIRPDVLSVPIQSVTIRDLSVKPDGKATAEKDVAQADDAAPAAAVPTAAKDSDDDPKKNEKEGVFVIRDEKAVFVPVKVGIAGDKVFEIASGEIKEGDSVVSGPFTAIRTLKDGDRVKIKKPDTGGKQKAKAT